MPKNESPMKILAEEHWVYTSALIGRSLRLGGVGEELIERILDLCHKLYVDAMIHGAKHQREDSELW